MSYIQKPLSYEYLAGLVDADGMITIRRSKPCGHTIHPIYRLTVRITNRCLKLLERIKQQFACGCIVLHKDKRPNRQKVYSWHIEARKAREFILKIYSFLEIKIHQALMGLAFQSTMSLKTSCGRRSLSPRILEKRKRFFDLMRIINKRGV